MSKISSEMAAMSKAAIVETIATECARGADGIRMGAYGFDCGLGCSTGYKTRADARRGLDFIFGIAGYEIVHSALIDNAIDWIQSQQAMGH